MGGTEIYEPLDSSINKLESLNPKCIKKIFLLTDGEVSSPDKVIQLAKKAAEDHGCRIHTIGIGSICSVKLVSDVARVGLGTCSLVRESKDLRSIVIQALARAQEPQYSNCKVKFSPALQMASNSMGPMDSSDGFEIFRHDSFMAFGIVKLDQF